MKKLLDTVKKHAYDVAAFAATIGITGIAAVLEDTRTVLSEHTLTCVLMVAASFFLGFTVSRILFVTSEMADKRRKVQKLERIFEVMPVERKRLVAQMLDDGFIETSPLREAPNTLCNQKIFLRPAIPGGALYATYSMNPQVAREIREHRSEWIDPYL